MMRFFNRYGYAVQILLSLLVALLGCDAGSSTVIFNFGELTYVTSPGWNAPVAIPEVPSMSGIELPTSAPPRQAMPLLSKPLPGLDGQVFFLSPGYSWVRGTPGDGEDGGPPQIEFRSQVQDPETVLGFFSSSGLQNQIRQATDVVAVGLSSCEGTREREHVRAEERAWWLSNLLQRCYPPGVDLPNLRYWVWNWGRFGASCTEDTPEERTRDQRSVMVIAVQLPAGEALDEDELASALRRLEVLPVRIGDYWWRKEPVPVNF